MNKIKDWTYLYKEILEKFDKEVLDICILDKNGNETALVKECVLFFICPNMVQNITMCKNLIKENLLYIRYGSFNNIKTNGNNYTEILNIGNEYYVTVLLKSNINKEQFKYICLYISILLADIIVVNKINDIDEGIKELDIALDLGKDIYAIPGDIFDYKNYLANFAIKQGAIPICSAYDIQYILREKNFNVL